MQYQIHCDRNKEFKSIELTINSRRIVIERIDAHEPLFKYIDIDKLREYANMKMDKLQVKINHNITIYDDIKPQIQQQQIGLRAYSANTKKRIK